MEQSTEQSNISNINCLQVFDLKEFSSYIDQLIIYKILQKNSTFYDLVDYLKDNKICIIDLFKDKKDISFVMSENTPSIEYNCVSY